MVPFKNPIGLALAGLAAFAAYKYSKMTTDQKRDLANNLKEKGRKIFGSLVPHSKTENTGQSYGHNSNYAG
jgi:hypothetical protein